MSTLTALIIAVVIILMLGPIIVAMLIEQKQDIKLLKNQMTTFMNQCELSNRLAQYKSDSGEHITGDRSNDMVI